VNIALQKPKVLFLFTKAFPFGTGEQYIEDELPFLSESFDQVVIYPTEWFGKEIAHGRHFPQNVRLLNFNQSLANLRKTLAHRLLALRFACTEISHGPRPFKELGRFRYLVRIAAHQLYTARNFRKYLIENFPAAELFFYSYWAHNSCVMLAFLKNMGAIDSFVTRAHSIDLYHHEWKLAASLKVPPFAYTKFAYTRRIFAVSRHGAEFLKKKFSAFADKIDYAYLGVSDGGVNESRSDEFTIVTCSNLSPNKRVAELAKAIGLVNFPVRWVHFGMGEQETEIRRIAARLPADKKIELRGQTPNTIVREHLAHQPVHVFINLSVAEGLPVSLMEASCAGIPLIATRVYGNPEIVIDGENGIVIDENFTPAALASALERLQGDPGLRHKFARRSRELYLSNFNAGMNYRAFAKKLLMFPNQIN
jgi:colanic acid/amylovoran biosynthesis glycosyltransferase